MTAEIDTVWFRHRVNGSLHEAEKGSESHRRFLSERTLVDEESGEVPEPLFERVSAGEVRKAAENPEKLPGYHEPVQRGPRRGQVVVQVEAPEGAGPSEDEIQARIDAAVSAAVEKALGALGSQQADPAEQAQEAGKAAPEAESTTPKATKAEPTQKKD